MFKYLLIVAGCILSSGCSSTSEGGVALGVKGSPAWNKTAPAKDIAEYYDEKRTYELCSAWDNALTKPGTDRVRRHIADALVRRGEPESLCFSAGRDAVLRASNTSSIPVNTPPTVNRTVNCTTYTSRLGAQTYCN